MLNTFSYFTLFNLKSTIQVCLIIMSNERLSVSTEGVQSLYSGVNHSASWERSYNADGQVYSTLSQITRDWEGFLHESLSQDRRRAVMRCYVSGGLLSELSEMPIEAAIPTGKEYLVWIGRNQHPNVSRMRDVQKLPSPEQLNLPQRFTVDKYVRTEDAARLTELWGQFGWTKEAVEDFVKKGANGNPIVLIRNANEEAVGVMVAESVEFGARRLVEITELSVDARYRGKHLASILIRELSKLSLEHWQDALVFGEYNLTTRSYQSAARAGQLPGQVGAVDGVLRDHVGIETGMGNQTVEDWDTRWLHNFLVMYQPNGKIR